METKELMIGDYGLIGYNKDLCRVELRGDNVVWVRLSDKSMYPLTTPSYPIPLTPEILEKNGFRSDYSMKKYTENFIVIINLRNNSPMAINNKVVDEFTRDYVLPKPHYVHELQHALRLCGLTDLADNL